jgi:glycyl-radical enzyme activating protein/glucokinase-like ROK family protein
MEDWVVGVDLGATKIELGLVSPQNEIVARRRMPTQAIEGPESVVGRIAAIFDELSTFLPTGQRITALGICSPGPVDDETGSLIDPPNLAGLHNAPLRQMLSQRLKIPVRLEHDAKATALGEYYYGAGQGEGSLVYIIIGTGVGAAIIEDGRLLRGKYNSAGEIGHVTLDRNGELCSCGSLGCVETFMSGPWLARRYLKTLQASDGVHPAKEITGEVVSSLAAEGDPLALRILSEAGAALGDAVAMMAMLFNIDLFVVGGSVSKAGDLLLEPARRAIPRHSYRSVGCGVQLVATEMGDDGPLLGCAWLARQAALEEASSISSTGSYLPQTFIPASSKPAPSNSSLAADLDREMALLAQVKGYILDVQRFSVHDGPGIRANIFLKGCPLRCGWCANPEGQRPQAELAFSAARCIRCELFIDPCWEDWTNAETSLSREKYAGRAEECPACAIYWLGRLRTAGEVIAEALQDSPFYGQGGGITLTGGEPTFQPRLAEALLRLAKGHGMNTAMETSGHTRWKVIERLLPYLDLILFDIKHLDPEIHRSGTGVDNELILSNLRRLAFAGAPLELRVPLVPTFNADPASLAAIADFVLGLEGVEKRLTLLPYHSLGKPKYQALGRPYPWEGIERIEDTEIDHLVHLVEGRGVMVTIGG